MAVVGVANLARVRISMHEHLRARRYELEQAILARVSGLSGAPTITDPEYLEGLRAAQVAALDYGLAAIECGEERAPPLPPILMAQARAAARLGISLDIVLRRYFAGYTLLSDLLVEEAEKSDMGGPNLKILLRSQATLFDRLLAAVSDEYGREAANRARGSEERRVERVKRLLAGELIDTSDLAYDFDGHHLGAIAVGEGAESALRSLGGALDCRLLIVRPSEETTWAWLGTRHGLDPEKLRPLVTREWPNGSPLALGEPSMGLLGWRMTHQQAKAALVIATRTQEAPTCYGDVALLASAVRDDVLVASLRDRYLKPLSASRDGGVIARKTLRAYFAAEQNVSSAAAVLGVSRRTVSNRLRALEEKFGGPLGVVLAEIHLALRIESLGDPRGPDQGS